MDVDLDVDRRALWSSARDEGKGALYQHSFCQNCSQSASAATTPLLGRREKSSSLTEFHLFSFVIPATGWKQIMCNLF